jgi:hypothetical protein
MAKLKPEHQRRQYPYQDCDEPHSPKSPVDQELKMQLAQAYQAGKPKQEADRQTDRNCLMHKIPTRNPTPLL